jgi:hypothetical protein
LMMSRSARLGAPARQAAASQTGAKLKSIKAGEGVQLGPGRFGKYKILAGKPGKLLGGAMRVASFTPAASARKDFTAAAAEEQDFMKNSGYTVDDYQMQLGGQEYYNEQKAKLDADRTSGKITANEHSTRLASLDTAKKNTKSHWGNAARSAAAVRELQSKGLIDDGTRKAIRRRFGDSTYARSLWSDAAGSVSDKNPHLMYTGLDGTIDSGKLAGYIKTRNQGTIANYSKEAFEAMATSGVLDKAVAERDTDPALYNVLQSVLTGPGGPSAGAEQQAILTGMGITAGDENNGSRGGGRMPGNR